MNHQQPSSAASPAVPASPASGTPRPDGRIILRGRIQTGTREIPDGAVVVSGEKVTYVGPANALPPAEADTVVDIPAGHTVIPGLVDLHCHGAFGADFPTGDEENVRQAIARIHASGTTSLLASLVTAAPQDLLRGVNVLKGVTADGDITGIHLEGPFLSRVRCGAQDPHWLLDPDAKLAHDLIAAADGSLRTMTYAPELHGADELVDLLADHGVTPSLGHTAADTSVAAASLQRAQTALGRTFRPGAVPTVTHLFNAMDPLHHRSPGAVTACLRAARAGNAVVELIADNTHLHPELVAGMFELLGADNIALVTDSMAAAGMSDGDYSLGPADVQVRSGVARLASGAIAGGTASMINLVRNVVHAGVPLQQALHSATAVPAGVLGMDSHIGTLMPGSYADLLVVDSGLQVTGVMRRGSWLQRD